MPDPGTDDSGDVTRPTLTTGAPRWAKGVGIVAVVLAVLVVVLLLSGGNHGPGRHASSGGPGRQVAVCGDLAGSGEAGERRYSRAGRATA